MFPSRVFPDNDWSGNRGCDRESYAQPGYWYNRGGGEDYYTDAIGSPIDAGHDATALHQVISSSSSIGAPATRRLVCLHEHGAVMRRGRETGPEELAASLAAIRRT